MAGRTRLGRPIVIALALALTSASVPSQGRDAPAVGALSGEMVVQADDGRTIGRLEATVTHRLG